MATIACILDSQNSIGRSYLKVLRTLTGYQILTWPREGLALTDIRDIYDGVDEFWIFKEACTVPAILFHSNFPRLFELNDFPGLTWLLTLYYPEATVRHICLGNFLIAERISAKDFPFSLCILFKLFHDVSNLSLKGNDVVCQRVSKWLGSLGISLLDPFTFFGRPSNWDNWSQMTPIDYPTFPCGIVDGYSQDIQGYTKMITISEKMNVNQFFYKMCRSYMELTTG